MKTSPVGAELFHADRETDGQTDRHDKANSRFPQFCKGAPKQADTYTWSGVRSKPPTVTAREDYKRFRLCDQWGSESRSGKALSIH